jgi:hypothetical protein
MSLIVLWTWWHASHKSSMVGIDLPTSQCAAFVTLVLSETTAVNFASPTSWTVCHSNEWHIWPGSSYDHLHKLVHNPFCIVTITWLCVSMQKKGLLLLCCYMYSVEWLWMSCQTTIKWQCGVVFLLEQVQHLSLNKYGLLRNDLGSVCHGGCWVYMIVEQIYHFLPL